MDAYKERDRRKNAKKRNLSKQEFVPRLYALKEKDVTVPISEMSRILEECFLKVNVERKNAVALAQVLLSADFRGLPWFGVELLGQYVKQIKANIVMPKHKPKIVHDYNSVAVVDGKNGLGPIIGNFCMQLAIDKAKSSGVGIVVAKNSTSYGTGQFFTAQALLHGFIGMSFSNDLPIVHHPQSKGACIGSNNMAMSAPCLSGEAFTTDFATSVICKQKLEYCYRHNLPIKIGLARNTQGVPTTCADEALKACDLYPVGDGDSGIKGFGLSLMVDVLCAALSESLASPFLQAHRQVSKPMKLSQCFIAIDPSNFSPLFPRDLRKLIDSLRHLPSVDPEYPVTVPGEREKNNSNSASKEGGIRMYESQVAFINTLAQAFYVSPVLTRK